MSILRRLHHQWVHLPRVKVLAAHFARIIPPTAIRLLDVGCGDGRLAREIQLLRPGLFIQGADLFVRPDATIPVAVFDGAHLPFQSGEFDIVLFADVLHHTLDPRILLREAARVARTGVAIKDHLKQGILPFATLALMDWVSNANKGVTLPYNYWRPEQWDAAFQELGLKPVVWDTKLGLYRAPFNVFFERSLHFLALLQKIDRV